MTNKDCLGCKKTVAKSVKALRCAKCKLWSHTSCLGLVDTDYDFMSSRCSAGFRWFCNLCQLDMDELISRKTVLDSGEALAAKVTSLVADAMSGFSERLGKIENDIGSIKNSDQHRVPPESFANVVKKAIEESNIVPTRKEPVVSENGKTQKVRPQSVLIVKPKDSSVTTSNFESALDDIEVALGTVPVDSFKKTKEGNVVLRFPSDTVRENARTVISSHIGDDSALTISEPKRMLPKMVIPDLLSNVADGDIVPAMLAKNERIKKLVDDGFALSLVFSRVKDDRKMVVLKMAPEIRDVIINQEGYIYLGRGRYRVHDRVWVTRCYHCQGYNHLASNCRLKDQPPRCSFCAGEHESRSCTQRNSPKCVNCNALSDGAPSDHYASSAECPLIKAQKKRIIENTNYLSSKN